MTLSMSMIQAGYSATEDQALTKISPPRIPMVRNATGLRGKEIAQTMATTSAWQPSPSSSAPMRDVLLAQNAS
jgi:hypothetical protein